MCAYFTGWQFWVGVACSVPWVPKWGLLGWGRTDLIAYTSAAGFDLYIFDEFGIGKTRAADFINCSQPVSISFQLEILVNSQVK